MIFLCFSTDPGTLFLMYSSLVVPGLNSNASIHLTSAEIVHTLLRLVFFFDNF